MVHRIRGDLRNHKIKKPLRRSPHSYAITTKTRREDLREVDPRDRAPGGRVANHVEVDHDNHGDGGGGDDVDVGGGMGMEHGADDEHHGHHPGGAEEEGFSTAEFVDPDEEEDACSADFDGAVDTGGEE